MDYSGFYSFDLLERGREYEIKNEPVHEKTNNLGSDQVSHKPVIEDGTSLEILDLESRGIVLSL